MQADRIEPPAIRKPHGPNGHHAMFRVRGESFSGDEGDSLVHSMLQKEVLQMLLDANLPFSRDAMDAAVAEFFTTLGLPRLYFDSTPAEVIATHVHSLMSARELARSAGRPADVSLSMEAGATAFFAARSLIVTDRASGQAGRDSSLPAWLSPANLLERYIETKYLQQGEATRTQGDADLRAFAAHGPGAKEKPQVPGTPVKEGVPPSPILAGAGPTGATATQLPHATTTGQGMGHDTVQASSCWRLQCYRSRGVLEDGSHLRLYFLQAPIFPSLPSPLAEGDTSLESLADSTFLARVSPELRDAYQKVLTEASTTMHPAIHLQPYSDVSQGEDSDVLAVKGKGGKGVGGGEVPVEGLLLMVGHRLGSTHSFFSGLPDIYRWHGMYAVAKFVEVFRNGIVVFSFRLRALDPEAARVAAPSRPLTGGDDFAARLKSRARTPSMPGSSSRPGSSSPGEEKERQPSPMEPSPPRLAASPETSWTPIPSLGPGYTDTAAGNMGLVPEGGMGHHPQISALPMMGHEVAAPPGRPQATPPGPGAANTHAKEPEYVRILRERRLAKLSGPAASLVSEERQRELARDVGLHFVLPRTSLSPLLTQGLLSAQETSYAYAAWKFAYHFLSRSSAEFSELASLVKGAQGTSGLAGPERTSALALISRLRKALQSAAFTEAAILDCIYRQVHVVAWLFDDYCAFNKPRTYVTTTGAAVYTPNPVSAALLKVATHSGSSGEVGGDKGAHGQPAQAKAPSTFTFVEDPALALKAQARARLTKGHGGPAAGPAPMGMGMGVGVGLSAMTPGSEGVMQAAQQQVPLEQAISTLRKMCGTAGVQTQADDVTILTAFLLFNRSVVRSNLFRATGRTSLAFRLDPARGFLSKADFAETPFAVFLVVGAEFRGFHVRFQDVARGGIRLVKSASAQAYGASLASLFEEVYTLSHTQSRKNKDLPEGGSKGIVLLNLAHQDKAEVAFQKYVDGLLDLITPLDVCEDMTSCSLPTAPSELLFLGPDENTADLMDWASAHARKRGYATWKAFTTGKAPSAGGMPHDTFGMTSRGVRAFEFGVQRCLHLGPWAIPGTQGSRVTKVQTGGPDGDLGSNEILLTGDSETYIGIVDGSGVLVDLDGLDPVELVRLARARSPVEGYDRSCLGPRGFLVTVRDTDVTLPMDIAVEMGADKLVVPFGVAFRNNAHMLPFLRAYAFVPCGGRPATVDMGNAEAFLYGTGKLPEDALIVHVRAGTPLSGGPGSGPSASRLPRFTYVVEGANSFFTNDARLYLDTKGVTVIKDASANKGGVTASSLEVMAALAMSDEEHSAHMCCRPGADVKAGVAAYRAWQTGGCIGPQPTVDGVPPFYAAYVCDAQDTIASNAALEFDALWREKESSGRPLPILTDALSVKITDLSKVVRESDALWGHEELRRVILAQAVPAALAQLLGGWDKVVARLPATYTRALFASRLSSRFVYACGLDRPGSPPEFAFWSWTQQMASQAGGVTGTVPATAHVPSPATGHVKVPVQHTHHPLHLSRLATAMTAQATSQATGESGGRAM